MIRSARKFFMLGRSLDDLVAGRPPVCEPHRGYGVGAVVIQHEIRDGLPWRQAAAAAFGGQGSCGNGATTRVTPLGAYHPERPTVAAEEAIESAEVVHAHPEGVAGAVLVAVAAAHAGARLDGAPAASGHGP